MGKLALVEGEVVTVDGGRATIDWYTEEFVLDGSIDSIPLARSVLQAGLVSERLRVKLKNFRRVRTCQVVELTDTDRKPEDGGLDTLLLKATQYGCVPEHFERYATKESRVRALKTAIERHESRVLSAEEKHDNDDGKKARKKARVTGGEFVD